MALVKDMADQTFGRLTALALADPILWARGAEWACVCECGEFVLANGSRMRKGDTRSCGCLRRDTTAALNRDGALTTRHGHAKNGRATATYRSWAHMLARCESPADDRFARYGGRGIRVSARWHDFAAFLADMGERPEGMTLDRIDPDGHYGSGNCRWATPKEQARHHRKDEIGRFTTAKGM